MTTHKLVGPPQAELVVRVEPPIPEGFRSVVSECDIKGQWWFTDMPRKSGMFSTGEFAKYNHLYQKCPYQPGDTLEFWPACCFCEDRAEFRKGESNVCPGHKWGWENGIGYDAVIPETRTVSRVTVRERDGWEWVVSLSEKEGN